jgi:hypothetical protein
VGKICFVFNFVLQNAYTADACALTSKLPSLSLKDMTYCKADQHTAFTLLNRYDILYARHENDAGVGLGRRRLFLY